jgi:hypothetical protein
MNAEPIRHDEGRWPRSRWLTLIALVFAAHIGLIFVFGGRKPIVPRAVTDVPMLQLAGDTSEWLALNDPLLFVLPRPEDFAGPAWLESPRVEFHRLEWTESPRWLQLPADELGKTFGEFMQTNQFVAFELELQPQPQPSAPENPPVETLAENSTLQIGGDLAQRRLLHQIDLPPQTNNEVIAPSKVQVIVDTIGNVISTTLVPPESFLEGADDDDAADLRALELARTLRFAPLPEGVGVTANPASRLTLGQLIFKWRTIAPPATNPPASP